MALQPRRRLRALDVLRGVAILLVLGHHVGVTPTHIPALLQEGLDRWSIAGWVGVDLFFVLSGFLVSGLLFQEYQDTGRVRLARFLARRGLKIYPAFYTLIAATIVAGLALGRPTELRRVLAEIFFVQNYAEGLWTHTWSLAVEEHFYLLLVVLIAFLARHVKGPRSKDPFRALVPLFCFVAVGAFVARVLTVATSQPLLTNRLTPTHLRIDSLFCGVVLSYLYHFRSRWVAEQIAARRRILWLVAAVCLTPFVIIPITSAVTQTIGFTSLYVGFGIVVALAVHPSSAAARPATPVIQALATGLAWLGTYSYSIYLWHMPAQAWSTIVLARYAHGLPSAGVAWTMYFGGAILIGVLMARIVERPGLALRERWSVTASADPQQIHSQLAAAATSDSKRQTSVPVRTAP
jgi:peptidoglycan/LPS O-acetylase OafA/YrhL